MCIEEESLLSEDVAIHKKHNYVFTIYNSLVIESSSTSYTQDDLYKYTMYIPSACCGILCVVMTVNFMGLVISTPMSTQSGVLRLFSCTVYIVLSKNGIGTVAGRQNLIMDIVMLHSTHCIKGLFTSIIHSYLYVYTIVGCYILAPTYRMTIILCYL